MHDGSEKAPGCDDGPTIDRRHYLGVLGGATVGLLGGVGGNAAALSSGDHPVSSEIGGGEGYDRTVAAGDATFVVSTRDELASALSSAGGGDVVFVDQDIDMGRQELAVTDGVTLASDRGVNGSPGARIYTTVTAPDTPPYPMFQPGANVRITGLRLYGPYLGDGWVPTPDSYFERYGEVEDAAIKDAGTGLEVDNVEAAGWGSRAMGVGDDAHVHHCYIHQCVWDSLGYGVSTAFAQHAVIEYNEFAHNRHSVAGSANGYTARYNYVRGPAISHVFDMHDGGTTVEVHHNTVAVVDNAQRNKKVPGVAIRGVPTDVADVHHNWFYNPEPPRATPSGWTDEAIIQVHTDSWQNVQFASNHYGSDDPGDPNVGAPRDDGSASGDELQVIPAGGEVVNYATVVDGDVSFVTTGDQNAGDSDALTSNPDGTTTIDGATGSDAAAGGDTYTVGGDVLSFTADNPLDVALAGQSTTVDALDANPDKFTLIPGGSIVDYVLRVDGTVSAIAEGDHAAGDADEVIDEGDGTVRIEGATGDQTGDMWRIDGQITALWVDGRADTWINGRAVSPADFGGSLALVEVSRAPDSSGTVHYVVETDGAIRAANDVGTGSTEDGQDQVDGPAVKGTVGTGTDPYWLVDASRVSVATWGGDVSTTLDGRDVNLTGWTSL